MRRPGDLMEATRRRWHRAALPPPTSASVVSPRYRRRRHHPPDTDILRLIQSFFPFNGAIKHDGHHLPLFVVQVIDLDDGIFVAFVFTIESLAAKDLLMEERQLHRRRRPPGSHTTSSVNPGFTSSGPGGVGTVATMRSTEELGFL
ncbi:unnamed protein product [Urochloa humidicola]